MSSAEEDTKIVFKKKSRKPLRKRRDSSDESNPDDNELGVRSKLEELKTIQKLRERPNGVNIVGLATGETVSVVETITTDPFNTKTGGLVDMQALKNAKSTKSDAYDTGIGTQFNAETNKRDEDKEMLKYIEENVAKRKNKNKTDTEEDESKNKPLYCSPEEAAFQAVPDHLRQSSSNKSEEMLSNQMLSGIPEVDLGIETKIRNIEATEEAKMKLLWERHKKKDGPSQFVPTNMAVNFVQHNRFNIEDPSAQKRKQEAILQKNATRSSNSRDKRKDGADEKATDDYHYERFKKQFRRF